MKNTLVLLLCLINCLNIYALKTSVIIPCHYKHVPYLLDVLNSYKNQTELPDEIIISISQEDLANREVLEKINNTDWGFSLKILTSKNVICAGENRNIGCSHASGDIFILQDADDIAHPQRIEIIKYFFDNHKLDYLIHEWQPNDKIQHFIPKDIQFSYCHHVDVYEIPE